MRIRKRFPLSSFSSPPHLSDPQLLHRFPAVQHPVHGGAQPPPPGRPLAQEGSSRTSPPPSDPPNQPPNQPPAIRRGSTRWVSEVNRQKALEGEEGEEERLEDEEERSKHSRKGSILCAQVGAGHLLPTASSHQEERVEILVPPKKRRGSFERSRQGDETAITMEEEKKEVKPEVKSKRSKKSGNNGAGGGKKKARVRGNEIMEGSRCSRVNGRGWRCCQPTLVGYSLCEHHLGKGRLRSMGSVPSSTAAVAAAPASVPALEDDRRDGNDDDEDEDEEEEEEEKPATMRKKRVKLGMVKARSISSLLGQTNNAVVAAAVCDDDK
ncbi:uncharacterized protein LOC127788248 [Diospyros lotus]|uniref:uncharacterized protein LOC127788248 n=1 Tax=Diospyros lotus TaxID=55363 RepID=UPI00225A07EF|nr:uncharacterized protein LOC127788248 [Diospyros lotus]